MNSEDAPGLLCYWTAVELGMSLLDLAGKVDLTPAAVSYTVQQGEIITREGGYQ